MNSLQERRPLSPHIQIYKAQITSLLSILHRGTGLFLFFGSFIWVGWLVSLALGPEAYEYIRSFLQHPLGRLFLMGWSFSFFYHLCNGLRHLGWDWGYGYEMPTVRLTGWIVIITSLSLTLLTWIFWMENNS